MNFYKLVYIKGISTFDTWRFTSKEQQYDYFDNLVGERIEDYYPPHYTNSIRFDKNDVDYTNSRYNYILLYFDNKYYCYFIDDLVYINEDVYELKLVKDTIQTYMFDVNFRYANVNRESIKRWIDIQNKLINRDYQRENLSKEEFFNEAFTNYSEDRGYGIIIECTEAFFSGSTPTGVITNINLKNSLFTSGYYYVYCPFIKYDDAKDANISMVDVTVYKTDGVTVDFNFIFSTIQLNNAIKSSYINNIYVVNNYFIRNYLYITIDRTEKTVTQEGYSVLTQYLKIIPFDRVVLSKATVGTQSLQACDGILFNDLNSYINRDRYQYPIINCEPNSNIGVPFDKRFIPQLIDENYIHMYYGEKVNYTAYPLSKSNKIEFEFISYYDIMTGERYYNILPYGENKDKYNSLKVSTSKEIMELFNDPWEKYQAQNYATLRIGRAMNVAKPLFDTATNLLPFNLSRFGFRDIKKDGSMSNKGMRALASPVSQAVGTVGDIVGDQLDYVKTEQNLVHTPDTERQGNNYSNDIMNDCVDVIRRIEYVKDIDNVAKLLEQFGYNVDKTYINTNIFNLNYRYYYNIVRCDNLQIDPVDCIIGNTDKNDFISRFQKGLRLWNKDNNNEMYDNLQYDNVENDFIQ